MMKTEQQETSRSSSASALWTQALPGLLLVLLVFLAYLPALRAGFIWDDDKYVTENPMLIDDGGLKQIWFSAHTQSQYFPLVYTTFRLEYKLWKLSPLGYHLVNIFLHGLNAVLVWLLLKKLRVPAAWLAAALFALHPVQVESVAWVTELKNVESLFFCLLALLAWCKAIGTGALGIVPGGSIPGSGSRADGRSEGRAERLFWSYYSLALAAYILALFAKTTACTLPAALVLILWLKEQRFKLREAVMVAPFVFFGVAMGLVSIWWEGNLGTYNADTNLSFSLAQRFLIASRALWFYAYKLLWPVDLAFSYPRWNINAAAPGQYIPLAACIVAGLLLWIYRRKVGKGVIAGVVLFVVSLAPLLGFISNYTFLYSFVADHYQYTASIGLLAVVAAGISSFLSKPRFPSWAGWSVNCLLIVLLFCLTSNQCKPYLNAETLWRDTLAKNPSSWMAHHNLAIELQNSGRIEEAMEHYQSAIALNPKHLLARNNLGLLMASKGNFTGAIEQYSAVLVVNPDFLDAQNNMAVTLAHSGDYEGAIAHLRKALEIEPKMLGAWLNLGHYLRAEGKTDAALETYRQALAVFPTEVEVWRALAACQLGAGDFNGAGDSYRSAIKLAPDRADLLTALNNVLTWQTNRAATPELAH